MSSTSRGGRPSHLSTDRALEPGAGRRHAPYGELISATKLVGSKTEPLLAKLKTHIEFLERNPNARAVGAPQKNLVAIETDLAALVAAMERSIAETDSFIRAMNG